MNQVREGEDTCVQTESGASGKVGAPALRGPVTAQAEHQLLAEARLETLAALQTGLRLRTHWSARTWQTEDEQRP